MAGGIFSSRKYSSARPQRTAADREILFQRSAMIMLLTTAVMGAFIFRLADLQLVQGQQNQELAEQNRIRLMPLPSDRGNITDRNGNLLAANRLTRSVYLWPRQQSPEQWQVTASRLSQILNVPADTIIERLEQVGYQSSLPVRISQQVSPTAFIALAEQASQFPGIEIQAESSRYYPHKDLAAHVIGYIGEATAEDIARNPQYPMGMIVGQMGIERLVNDQLEGVWGSRMVEVEAGGKELRWLGTRPTQAGKAVQLTLDLDMQQAAERALNGRRGAAVALDVKTGAVLAIASGPTFDPNLFTRQIGQAEWEQLQSKDEPFLNRAMQGYPPGSTFKIVTGIAGMQSGKFPPGSTIATSASIQVGGINFWEHSRQGFGSIGFRQALAQSSNTFFYRIGLTVGPEQISHWGRVLGIGNTSDLGLEGAGEGIIPTPDEKEDLYGEPWYAGDTVSMAIGQGLVQATPLEMAVMVGAIANGGLRVQPHLLVAETNTPETAPQETGIPADAIAEIRSGLIGAVQEGTAQGLNDGSVPLTAGKTGTSEVVGQPSHGLFVGYGPVSDPQIAVAVIIENGGYGGVAALPVAREIYKAYFKTKQ